MQTADCRMQSADRIQNVDCRLQSGYKMLTENLKCFFVWYVIMSSYNLLSVTQSLFCDQLPRLFALLWNIPGLFLEQNRSLYNFKPSYRVLSLCARFVWCDVCTDFTNLIKVDIDVNEMLLLNI